MRQKSRGPIFCTAPREQRCVVTPVRGAGLRNPNYFVFSGYTDMAIGLDYVSGSACTEFDSPYKARSIIEFRSRWHMTLTRFSPHIYNSLVCA